MFTLSKRLQRLQFQPSVFRSSSPSIFRPFSTTPQRFYPRKDTQDKDSLNPSSSEYSKSGTDDAAAGGSEAFDPDKTSPESEKKTAGDESGGDSDGSLEVSPGNPEVSQPRGQEEGGSQGSPRQKSSGGGSAPKSGGSKSG